MSVTAMSAIIPSKSNDKINSFLQDVQYHSLMVNSASFNVRLMRDRKTRLPFFDSQTGIAQNPCKLYMSACHRMPGIVHGQLYAYPAQRWCRRKRSYVTIAYQAAREAEVSDHAIVATIENPSASADDSNASFESKVHNHDMFFYEESQFIEEEEDEPDNEDDDTYSMRAKKKKRGSKIKSLSSTTKLPTTRGRKKRDPAIFKIVTDADDDNPGKPYECALCGARYKTRQGLSYHLSHTHRNNSGGKPNSTPSSQAENGTFTSDAQSTNVCNSNLPFQEQASSCNQSDGASSQSQFPDSYISYASTPGQDNDTDSRLTVVDSNSVDSESSRKDDSGIKSENFIDFVPSKAELQDNAMRPLSKVAPPNSYCDFCLGNSNYNVKTTQPEEMVSCADCGRSGHLTCLQFTANMIISVRQYRWQCIECKCCTLCGTSENDDKLLFCDDCDRGYHLYCLKPPLNEPPEGEWSCHLCEEQFHKNA